MVRASCCFEGRRGGDLYFDSKCPACRLAARLVSLVDLRGTITLHSSDYIPITTFLRNINGQRTSHGEDTLFGEVVAELIGVDILPFQAVINQTLRLVLNLGRALAVWAHGESVPWRVVLGVTTGRVIKS